MSGLLYANEYKINDSISMRIPTVGEIIDDEDAYFDTVCLIVATPYDMMAQLDDIGIDFTKINDFELFCLLFKQLQETDTSIIFGDLDLTAFKPAVSEINGTVVLWDDIHDIVIDRGIHNQIATFLRKLLYMKRNEKRPANEEARRYLIDRAKAKLKRRKKKSGDSQLEKSVIALVNTEQFPYDYTTVRDITIYQFYSSLQQITHKIKFDNTMIGYYAGTVKLDDLDPQDRNWILNST